VTIPAAPRPSDSFGFASRSVYGNFLSHLGILEQAEADGLQSVLILEDDAIFSRAFNLNRQNIIARHLASNEWQELFIGHSITTGLPILPSGLARFKGNFIWSHCYAV